MNKFTILLASLGLPLSSLHAQTVPLFINYQGKVTGGNGVPLGSTGSAPNFTAAPENRKVIFRIYDTASGNNRLWSEQQTVTIALGEFSVLLGQGVQSVYESVAEARPALDTVFNATGAAGTAGPERYLEIVVDDGNGTFNAATDLPITPRQRITTTGYSFRARVAETVPASAIDGTAIAANAITTAKVLDAAITTEKIQDLSVGTSDLANNSVTTGKIADGSILAADIADNQIIASKIPDGSITGAKITDGTIATGDIANGAVTADKLNLAGIGLWNANGASVYRGTGNVGIGTNAPAFPLSFATFTGDKISLWGTTTGPHFGFGINTSLLQIHTNDSTSDIGFGYGTSAAMTETVRIRGNGNMGIGTSNPVDRLSLAGLDGTVGRALRMDDGTTRYIRMYRSAQGFVIAGNAMPQNGFNVSQIQWDGDGNWDQSSDRTLKDNITDAEAVLDRLMRMPVRRYHWKNRPADDSRKFGVIAQEVQPLFPDVVGKMLREGDKSETLTVKYGAFGLIAAKAVQELKQEKDAEIKSLRDENSALKERLAALESKDEARDTKLAAIEKLLQSAVNGPADRTVILKNAEAAAAE